MEKPKLLHPFCDRGLLPILKEAGVTEIAPDSWMLEGNLGLSFFLAPPSSNVFILRDGDLVLLLDTGLHPFYRETILTILKRYSDDGAKTLVLMVTQGHWDHAMNNSVILETDFDTVRFLLPEAELPVIESRNHWLEDLRQLEYFYDPYSQWQELIKEVEEKARDFAAYTDPLYQECWQSIRELGDRPTRNGFRRAIKLYSDRVLFPGCRNMAEQAEILTPERRILKRFGDVECLGWEVGRFFVIHDGSHSPGHISVYDPLNKLLLTGDVTVEINPPFIDASLDKLIQTAGAFRRMAEQGWVEIATDSHRCERWSSDVFKTLGIEPLGPTELLNVVRGAKDCASFFGMFENYYLELKKEVLSAHARTGEATVPEIVEELFRSSAKAVTFKKLLPFPSRPELLVAVVLREAGYQRRIKGDRILFSPAEKWSFSSGSRIHAIE